MKAQTIVQPGASVAAAAAASHPAIMAKRKKKACVFFGTVKGCRNGNTCPFPHGSSTNNNPEGDDQTNDDSNDNVPPWIDAETGQTKTCKFFVSVKGCRAGAQCQFVHDATCHPATTNLEQQQQQQQQPGDSIASSGSATVRKDAKSVTSNTTEKKARKFDPNQKENKTRNSSTVISGSTTSISYAAIVKESSSRSATTRQNEKKGRSLAKGRVVLLPIVPPPPSTLSTTTMPQQQQQQSEQPPLLQLDNNSNLSSKSTNATTGHITNSNSTILAKAYELQRSAAKKTVPRVNEETDLDMDHSLSITSIHDKDSLKVREEIIEQEETALTPNNTSNMNTTASVHPGALSASSRKVQLFIDTGVMTPTTSNLGAQARTAADNDYGEMMAVCAPQAPRHHHNDHNNNSQKQTMDDKASTRENDEPDTNFMNPTTSREETCTSIYDTAVTTPTFSLELFEATESAGGWSSADHDGSEDQDDDDDDDDVATSQDGDSMVSDMTPHSDNSDSHSNDSSIGGGGTEEQQHPNADGSIETILWNQDLSSPSDGGCDQNACAAVLAKLKDTVGNFIGKTSDETVPLTLPSRPTNWEPTSASPLPIESSNSPAMTETSSLFVQAWTYPYGEQEVELWEQLESSSTIDDETLDDNEDDDGILITSANGGEKVIDQSGSAAADATTTCTEDLQDGKQNCVPPIEDDQNTAPVQQDLVGPRAHLTVVISFDAEEAQITEQTDWDTAVGTVAKSPSDFASPVGKIVETIQATGKNDGDESTLDQKDWCRDVEQPTTPGSIYSNDQDDREIIFRIAIKMKNKGNVALAEGQYQNAVHQYRKAEILLDEVLPAAHEFVHVSDCDFMKQAKAEKCQVLDNAAFGYLQLQEWNSAANCAIMVLEVDQQNESARYHLAQAFFGMENYMDCIDNAIRVRGEAASALVTKALGNLRSLVEQYESLFRLVIDSYRVREADEYLELRENGVESSFELHGMHPAERDSGEIPVSHFRSYISTGVHHGIIPRFVVEDHKVMQALLFMAHTDGFSNLAYPVTATAIDVFYHESTDSKEILSSLRKFALDVKGPIDQAELLSGDRVFLEEDTPSWQPTTWRYSCSHLSV